MSETNVHLTDLDTKTNNQQPAPQPFTILFEIG